MSRAGSRPGIITQVRETIINAGLSVNAGADRIRDIWRLLIIIACRHSRAGGNPAHLIATGRKKCLVCLLPDVGFEALSAIYRWIPACAGMTANESIRVFLWHDFIETVNRPETVYYP